MLDACARHNIVTTTSFCDPATSLASLGSLEAPAVQSGS